VHIEFPTIDDFKRGFEKHGEELSADVLIAHFTPITTGKIVCRCDDHFGSIAAYRNRSTRPSASGRVLLYAVTEVNIPLLANKRLYTGFDLQ
jgi:hypothetical protein